jgi:hypothetical protein
MDAVKIGLETIIVGALALPWIFLVVDLFCPSKESLFDHTLPWIKDNQAAATAAGVLLTALAYLMGSGVGRVAQDFLRDDDPGFGVTEDTIRSAVYCRPRDPWLVETGGVLVDKDTKINGKAICSGDADEENRVRQTFSLQEAMLLSGADTPDRVRYLHQQITVLQGVALDGVITMWLCLFGFFAARGNTGRIVLAMLSSGLFIWAIVVTGHHLHRIARHQESLVGAPPLLEIFLFLVAVAGLALAMLGARKRAFGCGLIFSTLLTALAVAGWWYGQIVYDQTVIYFYAARPVH